MRSVRSFAIAPVFAMLSGLAFAGSPSHKPALAIVLDFRGPHSQKSVDELKREFAGIMKDSGMTFEWRSPEQAAAESFDDLVVVRFNGKCLVQPAPYLYDERGPLAYTYSSPSSVLPYSEVACDHVAASVRSAMFGGDFKQADKLMGRALARVVAHEVLHVLTQSGSHGRDGIARTALTGKQLIGDSLPLESADLDRVRAARAAQKP